MNSLINPYYNPEKLGLEMLSYDDPGSCYDFNTLCFWSTGDGRVYSATDSGCPCPIPFEDYDGKDQEDVLQRLQRIGSVDQAEAEFRSWNNSIRGKMPSETEREIAQWVSARLQAIP